ncbi:MAG: inositol monophosphatase [Candidatus Micrarchaeota archaeon]|nr:inositol monophosphatase [Candidatus Micrarchaeota archaeon]
MDTNLVQTLRDFMSFSSSYLHREFTKHTFHKREKEKHDFVTDCDLFIEDKFRDLVLRHWPDSSIVAEERNSRKGTGKYTFIIDPIDGTNNFSAGIPVYGTSISVFKENEPYYSIVSLSNDILLEAYNHKSYLNNNEVIINSSRELRIILSDSRFEKITLYCNRDVIFELAEKVGKFRMLGAAVYNISYVALGYGVVSIEFDLKPVDYPGCAHFLENAGGIAEPFHGSRSWKDLKPCGLIFAQCDEHLNRVKEIVKKYLKEDSG